MYLHPTERMRRFNRRGNKFPATLMTGTVILFLPVSVPGCVHSP